ncbi:MAG TPA: IS21 family transposase [Arthrobacter bacterium]|nr:IS21 family transposase [Arthrobacter sp.]
MPNERISMRKIKEVLRLHLENRQSGRAVARSLAISPATVTEYLCRFRTSKLAWPLPVDLDDEALERLLFPPPASPPPTGRVEPDWNAIQLELKRKDVTLQLLWEEYKVNTPDGLQYSRFCELYRRWAKKIDVTMRQHHKAGEKLFVDYAGRTMPVTDPATGEVRQAQIFVAVLGASNYTYAEATWSQDVADWVGAHVRALEFFGGSPALIIPDNLKSGVTRACRYEPDIQTTYFEMARHYGTAVMPARVRKPRDKAKAEVGVQVVQRWITASLRNRTFFSLPELNAAVRTLLERLNDKPFKKIEGTRRGLFLALDKPVLKVLPASRFEIEDWRRAKVYIDYHIEVDRHYYSVSYRLVGETVEARLTSSTVEILHAGKRIASHARSRERWKHTTLVEHMPANHQFGVTWTPARIANWAGKIGPHVAGLAMAIMRGRDHPEQGFRACMGLVRLEKVYGAARLDAACQRALNFGVRSYKGVLNILVKGLDGLAVTPTPPAAPTPDHENVRGAAYYIEESLPC